MAKTETKLNELRINQLSSKERFLQAIANGEILDNEFYMTPAEEIIVPQTQIPFTQASTRANISSNETIATVFGKIAKWFSDLGSLAFKSTVARTDLETGVQTSLGKADNAVPNTRTVNGKALSSDITLSASDVGARADTWLPTTTDINAVPNTRTVNSKALSSNITLTAADVGARANTWTPSAADVGAVPTTRTINTKALSSNITLTAADVGARANTWLPTPADIGAVASTSVTDTYSATGTSPVTGKAVASAINALDVTGTTSFGAGKTISSWSETDGKISITSQNISITKSQVSDFPTLSTVATSGLYSDLTGAPTIPTVTDTYNSGSSNAMSGKAVAQAISSIPQVTVVDTFSSTSSNAISGIGVNAAIGTLDVTGTTAFGAGKTILAWSETNGKVSITSQDILITKSQISDFPQIPDVSGYVQKSGDTMTGNLTAPQYNLGENVSMKYDATDDCVKIIFN